MTTKKKKIILTLITTIIVLLAYGSFFKFHLVSDAYRIIDNNNAFMINLKLNEGRLVQVLYFVILSLLGISINSINMYMLLYRINYIISIILLICSIILVYNLFKNNIKNITTQKKIVVYVCVLFIFINISVSEYMLYLENCIMILGMFLSVIAANIYHSNIKLKYLIINILILISSFCYQGVAQLFPLLCVLILTLKNSGCKQKYYLQELLKILLLYLSPLVVNYLVCWWLNSIVPNIDPRLFTGILQSIKNLLSIQNILVLIVYMYLYMFIFLFNTKTFTGENSKEKLLNIFYLMIISIISFVIFVFNNSVRLQPRTMLNFIIIYPVLKIYIISLKQKEKYATDIVLTIILLILNILLMHNLQMSNIDSTNKNIEVTQLIIEKINEYEIENNIKIQNVAFYNDSNLNSKYWNADKLLYYAYTAPTYYGYWCDIYSINVLSERRLNRINDLNVDTEIKDFFNSKNWDSPNMDEQIIFKGNTVHICRF